MGIRLLTLVYKDILEKKQYSQPIFPSLDILLTLLANIPLDFARATQERKVAAVTADTCVAFGTVLFVWHTEFTVEHLAIA